MKERQARLNSRKDNRSQRDVLAHNFADEWLMVTENTEDLHKLFYSRALESLKSVTPVATLGDQLQGEWERLAERVTNLVSEQISEGAGLYVGQMLQGWGSYPFDIIARHAIERVNEDDKMAKEKEKIKWNF